METTSPLLRATPESQGIPSQAISTFIKEADRTIQHLHSFMLLRHGKVIAEGWWHPYRPDLTHMMFSLSKSFTSTAVGLAVHDGLLAVDDPVLKFFPEEAPHKVSPNLAAMQVRHLLSMSTGHHEDTTERVLLSREPFRTFLSLPVVHVPGTFFVYNTAASFMLAAIVQKLTGQTLLAYLTPRLLLPLGIANVKWDAHPNGVNFGGFGMHLKTEDIARFGQLYLQKGWWQGRQLVPEAWVAEATAKHVSNGTNPESDWEQGYAYHFWRCRPPGVYRGDGAFGQYCVVMPDQETVIAITSGLGDMQPVLSLVWEHLLPALSAKPLPEDPAANRALTERLARLRIPLPAGGTPSILEAGLSGAAFTFPSNPLALHSLSLDFNNDILSYRMAGGEQRSGSYTLSFGRASWKEGDFFLGPDLYRTPVPTRALASGAWSGPETFTLTVCQHETPFLLTIDFSFAGEQVSVRYRVNYSFGPTELPPVVGERAYD